MIERDRYEQLKKESGKVSSWAIWRDPEKDKPASGIGDLSVFDDPGILNRLQPEYIFVGLNAAAHDDPNSADWAAFHSGDNRRQRDYKLRFALKGTEYWGAYITDAIKNVVETNSGTVVDMINKDPDLLEKSKAALRRELDIIGGEPTLIAIGKDAYRILQSMDLPVKNILQIPHYSAWGSKENYRAQVLDALTSLKTLRAR